MTTKLRMTNCACSNGDLGVSIRMARATTNRFTLAPGETREEYVSTAHEIEIVEYHPGRAPPAGALWQFAEQVDDAIAKEARVQIKMWGTRRTDNKNDELLDAAITSAVAVSSARNLAANFNGDEAARAEAFLDAKEELYPADWSPDAFRDYGSDFANLAVAAAFIRNQMLEMLMKGEDTTRTKRGEPYKAAKPFMSAEAAGAMA